MSDGGSLSLCALSALRLFAIGIYLYSIKKVSRDDFKDVDEKGNIIKT
jgi:hypothetical protein